MNLFPGQIVFNDLHSGSNRFVSRIALVVLVERRSIDAAVRRSSEFRLFAKHRFARSQFTIPSCNAIGWRKRRKRRESLISTTTTANYYESGQPSPFCFRYLHSPFPPLE